MERDITHDYLETGRNQLFRKFQNGNPNVAPIRYGLVIQLNGQDAAPNRIPGTIDILCTDGRHEINVHVLGDGVDPQGEGGGIVRPFVGAHTVVANGPGGDTFALGFARRPISGYYTDNGVDQYDVPKVAATAGDWVRISRSGAYIRLARSGLIWLEANPGCRMMLNPQTGEVNFNSLTTLTSADGYIARRGRVPGSSTTPNRNTISVEKFQDQANSIIATSVTLEHGTTSTPKVIRKITIKQSGKILLGQETYDSSAKWVGKMMAYRWGSEIASEPFVLGNALMTFLEQLLDLFAKHTHGTGTGPSSPPIEASEAVQLKIDPVQSTTLLSDFMYGQKLPPVNT